jgi:hypothetical protein
VLVVAGTVTAEAAGAATAAGARVISLVERYGRERALGDTARCIEEAAAEGLAALGAP